MFKPGTLVKLNAKYNRYRVWLAGYNEDCWLLNTDIGLMLGNYYDNRQVHILVGDRIIIIPPEVLNVV